MRQHAKIDLESRLLAVRDDLLARARTATEAHARRVAAARAHGLDRAAAAVALEAIAKTRSYRLGGHASFDAFLRAEIGISRATASRLRALADPRESPRREAEAAALALGRWLRARGIRSADVRPTAHRKAGRVQIVLDAKDVARIVGTRSEGRRPPGRRRAR